MDNLTEKENSLANLPTELLVKVMSYLAISGKIQIGCVSRRFKAISETPSLWKLLRLDYEFRHAASLNYTLKASGEHVRRIFLSSHMTPEIVLEMARCCVNVTHLSLPRSTQLYLDHLEELVRVITGLQQLVMFTGDIKCQFQPEQSHSKLIKRFIRFTAVSCSVKKLTLRIDRSSRQKDVNELKLCDPIAVIRVLEELANEGLTLPPVINLLINDDYVNTSNQFLESWSAHSYAVASCEIYLYSIKRVPVDLYPSMPLRKFRFGPVVARPDPFIKLSEHGILGLEYDVFYLIEYDHLGLKRFSIRPCDLYEVKKEQLHCINRLHFVTSVDFSECNVVENKIYPGHLEQLAFACPNLQRLDLTSASCCLKSLQGLRAIVDTCQDLQGLNLVGIPVSSLESYLIFWELLCSIKKLTYLAISLCMLIRRHGCDGADHDKQIIVGLMRSCKALKALEVIQRWSCDRCRIVPDVEEMLFSNFPSLLYVRLLQAQCTAALKYTVMNCHHLKYFCCNTDLVHEAFLIRPSSSCCQLHELCIESPRYLYLSTASVHALSAHGKLEQVTLIVRSITTNAITALIKNSPQLILLYVVTREPLCDDSGVSMDQEEYTRAVSIMLPYHKLRTAGDFVVMQGDCQGCIGAKYETLCRFYTNFNSLWNLP